MNIKTQRALSIKIIENSSMQISLYDYEDEVKDDKDVTDICAFLSEYTTKYGHAFFEVDVNNALFLKKNSILSDLIRSIRNLKGNEFEKLSAVICKCLGFNNFHATQPSKDEGIDFIAFRDYSLLKIGQKEHIVGQCKHYADAEITVKDIRELSGSVLLFSRQEFASTGRYKDFILGAFSIVNVYFISSFFFAKPAEQLCHTTQIVPLDIIDVICICLKGIKEGKIKWIDSKGHLNDKKIKSELAEVKIVS